MTPVQYPSLFQINTRVWLTERSRTLGRPATLDDIPDVELDRVAKMGFDWIWLLSVWQTGTAGQRVSRSNHEWRKEFQDTLPDLREEDIAGSGFAITAYTVSPGLGGEKALARLRERLRTRGLRLLLDFVPNHTGLDHPWVEDHPEYYMAGTESDLAQAPQNYTRVKRTRGDLLLAQRAAPRDGGVREAVGRREEAEDGERLDRDAEGDGQLRHRLRDPRRHRFRRPWRDPAGGHRVPVPASGPFNLVVRDFWPTDTVLDGSYKVPPVRKVK